MDQKKVIVIGGGIIGLCTAYYLHKVGHQVTVLDKSDITSGASFVNAGYLTPSHIIPLAAPGMITKGMRYMFDTSSPFYMKPRLNQEFLKWAWYFKKSSTRSKVEKAIPIIKTINVLSRELYGEIHSSGDLGDFHLERKGLLMLYQTKKEAAHEFGVAEKATQLGLKVNHLDTGEIKKIEPHIGIDALGAFHYESDGHMTPSLFMERMLHYLTSKGVETHKGETVLDISLEKEEVKSIHTDKGNYSADEVVFAAGTWTKQLLKKLHIELPLEAGKGYCIDVKTSTNITMPAILMEAKMAVTPMQGFTRFAGTMEFSGVNHNIRYERVEAIANGASRYYSGLNISEKDKTQAKCGLRPVTPDGLPYIGTSSKYKNLTIATGHAMMGWSLGPITGKLVSEIVSKKQPSIDIAPFSPQRKF